MRKALLPLLMLSASSVAMAAEEPGRGPVWDWVKPLPIPAPDPARKGAPGQSLLLNAQTRYSAASDDHYAEFALLIQNPQGLAASGTLSIPWHPDLSDLIIHKVHIVRDGKVIDVLANGQKFTVLRRENNLEQAMLDGVLTAVLQPEGLAVGDIVNVAYTIRQQSDRNGFRTENVRAIPQGIATERVFSRDIWPGDRELRWKAGELMPKPKLQKTQLGTELVVDVSDAVAALAPQDAPLRYRVPPTLEISAYSSWNEISAIAAPLYSVAATLPQSSPLRTEIERIAASSADPAVRAMGALRLVQDKVRYVALAMGDGGVVPATAEQTWSRKYGDCKGKTVTLLAILKELGIEAEPMLVSSTFGDTLGERLPMARLFDHVIVRARIAGKILYLDGTRSGDRSLDALATASFGYGLPLRAAGAQLEKLPQIAPAEPLTEVEVTYDASKGFNQAVPVSGTVKLRGDLAIMWRTSLAETEEAEVRKALKEAVPRVPNEDFEILSINPEAERGSFSFSFSGKTRMRWSEAPSSRALRFQFDDRTVNWAPEFKREAGPFREAPFALSYPEYDVSREIVILPNGGAGFSLDAPVLNATVAGTQISRTVSIQNGRAVAVSSFRRLQPEIGAAEALAAAGTLKKLKEQPAFLRSPEGYRPSSLEVAAIVGGEPKDAAGFVERGFHLMGEGKLKSALADFDRAVELEPRWSLAHANRAVALLHKDKEAEAALAKAAALNDKDFVVHQAYGMLHAKRGHLDKAVEAFTRSLSLDADNVFNLNRRASAYEQLGKLEEALTDVEKAASLEPKESGPLWRSARLNAALGRPEAALAAAEKAAALKPDDPFLAGYRGELLARFGRKGEALQAFGEAIRLIDKQIASGGGDDVFSVVQKISLFSIREDHKGAIALATARLKKQPDSIQFLTARCLARAAGGLELEEGLKDCDLALKLEPENAPATEARAFIKLRMAKWDGAIADYSDQLRYLPNTPRAFYGRGIAKLRKGDRSGGEQDIAQAKRYGFDTFTEFESYGIRP